MRKKLLFTALCCLTLTLAAQAPSGYYNNAQGQTGYSLKTALHNIIDNVDDANGQPFHMPQSYGDLWDVYEDSDSRIENGNTFVWEMYSDCDFEFVVDQDMGSGGGNECEFFNREHSFPRSWFDNDGLPIFTDPFHVIPADKKVNGMRGNLAYGEVSNVSYTSNNGSKIGSSALAGPTGNVFEPIDEFKGDIARQYFYVATRYENLISGWETNDTDGDSMLDGSSDQVFEDWALNMLYEWHVNDPVSAKELQRQEAIFDFQGNRNPFIDNEDWVFEIWGNSLSTNTVVLEEFKMYPNPTNGNTLNFNLPNADNSIVEIYSILGNRVLTTKGTSEAFRINIGNLASGVYLVKIQQGQQLKTLKLIRR